MRLTLIVQHHPRERRADNQLHRAGRLGLRRGSGAQIGLELARVPRVDEGAHPARGEGALQPRASLRLHEAVVGALAPDGVLALVRADDDDRRIAQGLLQAEIGQGGLEEL